MKTTIDPCRRLRNAAAMHRGWKPSMGETDGFDYMGTTYRMEDAVSGLPSAIRGGTFLMIGRLVYNA